MKDDMFTACRYYPEDKVYYFLHQVVNAVTGQHLSGLGTWFSRTTTVDPYPGEEPTRIELDAITYPEALKEFDKYSCFNQANSSTGYFLLVRSSVAAQVLTLQARGERVPEEYLSHYRAHVEVPL